MEEAEKTKDSRLAREFVAALPIELGKDEWVDLLSKFIQEEFVDEGMCADVAIHDTDGHNPHAHIMLTVRPLNENGTWQHKTEKEYLCVKDGEERGFTAAEFMEAQKRIELLTKKKTLSPLQFSETRRLNAKIAKATEDLEELKSRKEQIMFTFGKYDDNGMKDVKSWINRREEQIQKAEAAEDKYSAELNKALSEYRELEVKAAEFYSDELNITRLSFRPEEEMRAVSALKSRYGNSYDPTIMLRAKDKTANLLSKESINGKDHSPNQNHRKTPEKEFHRKPSRKEKAKEWER